MISFALATAMTLAAAQADATTGPRRTFVSCLSGFRKKSASEKLSADAFSAAIKTACQTEAAALRQALVTSDVKVGIKRATAEANADEDLGYQLEAMNESFRDSVAPRSPQ